MPEEIGQEIEKLKKKIQKEGLVVSGMQKIISPTGQEENWLFDLRNVFLKPEALNLLADIFWARFKKDYPFQIGGQEIAAIPLVSAIVLKSHQLEKPANGFIIRKSRKATGLQKLVEGGLNNEKIILVDDLINSGSAIMHQLKVLEHFGKKVDFVFTLVNFRGEQNVKLLEKKNIELVSIFSLKDFGLSLNKEKKEPPKQNFRVLWRFQAPDPNYFYVLPKSTPCLDEKKIYFGSDNGTFWALNQEDGSVAWKFKVGYPAPYGKTIFSSPAIHEDLVYFGSYDGNVYTLDKNTGEMRWKFQEADWVGSSPAIAPDLNMLFIGLEFGLFRKKGGITALDIDTGKKIWDYRMSEYVHCSPAYCVEKRVVAIGGNDHYAYMFKAKNGKLLWKFKTGGDIKASFCFDVKRNLVLFGSFDNNLYALDIDTGEVKGKFETKDYIYSTPKVVGDNVYFTSTDKNLYSMNLDTGKLNWRFAAGGRIFSSPEIVDDKILIGATNGVFYEINAITGKVSSFFQTTERITSKIVYNSESKSYFALTYANEIYCLGKESYLN